MNTKLFIIGLLSMASCVLTGCQDDKSGNTSLDHKEKLLFNKYPQAENISWRKSKDNKYDIATFTLSNQAVRAVTTNTDTVQLWFSQDDQIRLAHQEITYNVLPTVVQNAFQKTKCNPVNPISDVSLLKTFYHDTQIWEIDDIYKLERDGAVSYKIEMEAIQQDIDINLYYDEQGILLKEVQEDEEEEETPLELPDNVKEWISTNHSNAEILDYEMEEEENEKEHELDLKEGKIILEITLSEINNLLKVTEEEYNYPNLEALPSDIRTKAEELLNRLTDMSESDIDEIEMEKDSNGNEIYSIELENSTKEITIKITKDSQGIISGETEEKVKD